MNVNFFATCVDDAPRLRMVRDSVLLPEKLDCRVNLLEKQGYCGQPTVNSSYIKKAIPETKSLITALEDNDDPIISPTGPCTYVVKSYPTYLANEPEWALCAEKVAARMQDLTSFIVNILGVVDVGISLQEGAVYRPSCGLTRKLGMEDKPLTLLKDVCGLELLIFAEQDTYYGFGGTLSVEMAEISGEVVKEKAAHLVEVRPEYLINADASCLLSIGGRLQRERQKVKVMYIAEMLMSR